MGNRLSKIYTRTGDDGTTGLGDGSRVPKESARVEAYGTVDELNSTLGVLLAVPALPPAVSEPLGELQHELFDLGAELCIPGHRTISAAHVTRLEQMLDASTTICRRSRSSSCRAADPPRRPVTWRAPSRGARSDVCGCSPGPSRSPRR